MLFFHKNTKIFRDPRQKGLKIGTVAVAAAMINKVLSIINALCGKGYPSTEQLTYGIGRQIVQPTVEPSNSYSNGRGFPQQIEQNLSQPSSVKSQ
jgi:hypothetical protein